MTNKKSTKRSTKQSTKRSTKQSTKRSTKQSTKRRRTSSLKNNQSTKSIVKKKTSSLIRHYFGSNYKKKLAIRQAEINANKISSKKGLLKFISDTQNNSLFQASKRIPIVLYQIILLMNLFGQNSFFNSLSIQKSPLVTNILFSKASWIIKLNRLSSVLIYELEKIKDIALNKNPEVILQLYGVFIEIQNILNMKLKVNFLDPEVILNILVFSLNSKLMYDELNKNDNNQLYKNYFDKLDKLQNKGIITSDFKKNYILLLQDILNCHIDSNACNKNSTDIYNYSLLSRNDKETLQFKDQFIKLRRLNNKYLINSTTIKSADEVNSMLEYTLNTYGDKEYTNECSSLLSIEFDLYKNITGTIRNLDLNVSDNNVLDIYKTINMECRKKTIQCKNLGILYHPDKSYKSDKASKENFEIYRRIQNMLQTVYSSSQNSPIQPLFRNLLNLTQ